MTSATNIQSQPQHSKATLDTIEVDGQFILEERSKHDVARLFVETALCVIVGVVYLGSFVLFFLPEIQLINSYPAVSMSVVMVSIALLLYAFATRGYKPQAGFDKAKQQFWTCKLNSKGRARIVTYFSRADVRSVFIRRPGTASKDAALCAWINGKLRPITLIRGSLNDVEAAHRELCEAMHDVKIVTPAKPVLNTSTRTARPILGAPAETA